MPVCYGGGIKNSDDAKRIINIGVEKICISSSAIINSNLIYDIAKDCGSQSVVVCVDVKKSITDLYDIYIHNGKLKQSIRLDSFIKEIEDKGAGELLINNIDLDGTMKGYDINLLQLVTNLSNIPVIACGGAGSLYDLKEAVLKGNVDAVAAGSIFVYFGRLNGILINYPKREKIKDIF